MVRIGRMQFPEGRSAMACAGCDVAGFRGPYCWQSDSLD